MSLPLSPTMVELFFAREELKARRILKEQMDSCLDTIFGQMKRKLMQLVESGRGGGETGHGLGELGDSKDRGQKLYGSSNDFSPIPSTSINSDHHLSGLNISKLSTQNVSHQPQRQLHHFSSNPISTSTSTNSTHVPDNDVATSNPFNDDNVIIVKNKLVEKVNIIPNDESISTSSSSTQSQPSNDDEQSNDSNSIDDDNSFKEEDDDDGDDDDVQSNEDLDEIENSSPRPTKRPRLAKTNNATDSDIQPNCDESESDSEIEEEEEEDDAQLLQRLNLKKIYGKNGVCYLPPDYGKKKEKDVLCPECQEIVASKEFTSHMWRVHNLRGRPPPRGSYL